MSSFAHDSQILGLKDHVYALPEGAYLFPLNGRVFDTTNEIPILNNSITYRDDEKKFLGSVAIEDGTTNIISSIDPNYTALMDTVTPPPVKSPYPDEIEYHIASGNYGGIDLHLSNASFGAGEKFSVSCYIYIQTPCTAYFNLQADSTEVSNEGFGSVELIAKNTGWYRIEWHNKSFSASRTNVKFRVEDGVINTATSANNWSISSNECWMTAPQVERRENCTSFVIFNQTRGEGNLVYDISSLGMRDRGFVSFWMKNSHYVMNNSTENLYFIKMRNGTYAYDDSVTIQRQVSDGAIRFWVDAGSGNTTNDSITHATYTSALKLDSWSNYVIQWDKNGTANGNTHEIYIDGTPEGVSTSTHTPIGNLTHLYVGSWDGSYGTTNTQYEQLILHPSKTFTAQEIELMYKAQSPIYDWRDQILFW